MCKYEKRDRKRDNLLYFLIVPSKSALWKNGHQQQGNGKRAACMYFSAGHDNWGVHSFPLGGADINHGPFIPPFVGAAPRGERDGSASTKL